MKLTVEDKYSDKAKPRYGWHDYECTITFEPLDGMPVEEVQREIVEVFRARKKNSFYMWCHEAERILNTSNLVTWKFNYGYDSGD